MNILIRWTERKITQNYILKNMLNNFELSYELNNHPAYVSAYNIGLFIEKIVKETSPLFWIKFRVEFSSQEVKIKPRNYFMIFILIANRILFQRMFDTGINITQTMLI